MLEFNFFDPDEPIHVSWRNLPHWEQEGATYFITFRTNDSMPREVIERWRRERIDWLERQGIVNGVELTREQIAARLPARLHRQLQSYSFQRFEQYLDDCHGPCHLRRGELAKIVAKSLLHFDGIRYQMSDFVVMPNHVHLLVGLYEGVRPKQQGRTWKQFTATRINRALGTSGRFWQPDQFDHLVRSADQFEYLRDYIAKNPQRANLREGEYIHYVAPRSAWLRHPEDGATNP